MCVVAGVKEQLPPESSGGGGAGQSQSQCGQGTGKREVIQSQSAFGLSVPICSPGATITSSHGSVGGDPTRRSSRR